MMAILVAVPHYFRGLHKRLSGGAAWRLFTAVGSLAKQAKGGKLPRAHQRAVWPPPVLSSQVLSTSHKVLLSMKKEHIYF